jgi:hypothetical protein
VRFHYDAGVRCYATGGAQSASDDRIPVASGTALWLSLALADQRDPCWSCGRRGGYCGAQTADSRHLVRPPRPQLTTDHSYLILCHPAK